MTPTGPNERARELLADALNKNGVPKEVILLPTTKVLMQAATDAIVCALSHAAAVEGELMAAIDTGDWEGPKQTVGADLYGARVCISVPPGERPPAAYVYTAPPPAPAAVAGGDAEEDAYVIDALAHLLAEISVIVNGPEPAGTKWSYHDLPEKVRALKTAPAAVPAGEAVAYLDIGVGGYLDLGTEKDADELFKLPPGRHMLGIIGTYGVDGYKANPPAAEAPAPVQAAPQEGCPFCGGTGGHWEGCRAPVDTTAHPSACELGADGVGLIAAERQRQISAEGWTPEHDDEHDVGELATAAACYAAPDLCRSEDAAPTKPRVAILAYWPWALSGWKPGDRIRELVKAGALIAAEIDRLQRAALQHRGDSRGGEQ